MARHYMIQFENILKQKKVTANYDILRYHWFDCIFKTSFKNVI